MPDRSPVPSVWDHNGPLYTRYTSNAAEALRSNDRVRAAHREWERFLVESHGDVFGDADGSTSRRRLLVDVLYYDLLVDRTLAFVEREFDVRVMNPEAGSNTDALSVAFGSLHDEILDPDVVEEAVDDRLDAAELVAAGPAFLRGLYERVVAADHRLPLGEFYTPRGVAELAVSELDVDDPRTDTFLDPGCGAGVFLAAAIDAKRAALADGLAAAEIVDAVTDTVFGIDINPVAVRSAKLAYLLALLPSLGSPDVDRVEIPVFLTDSLGLTRDDELRYGGEQLDLTVDHLVGNPPWITWGNLSEAVRDAWRETYAARLDLLPHRGIEGRLGHANDDVSVPFVWVCVHRYLAEGGDAGFVLKRGLLKGPAGRLFRSQRVNGRPVAVSRVHDFTTLRPFGDDVAVDAALYTLSADATPEFPIPTASWTRGDADPDFSTAASIRDTLDCEETGLVPVEEEDPSASWIRTDAEDRALGPCAHEIRHGVKDDAKAVYGIDRRQLDELERDHVYPYLRSKHVVKYGLFGHDLHLVPVRKANEDNEKTLRERCPNTYQYLESNRETLEDRSSSWLQGGTFYDLFGLGEYTWAAYKVVWCRLGFKPHFAVVSTVEDADLGEKTVVPGDHCMFVSTDEEREAHFLCALLNSAVYQAALEDVASGGKSSLSKGVVSKLYLPEYDGSATASRLVELSMQAHEIVPEHTDVSKRTYNRTEIEALAPVQAEIDDLAERFLSRR